MSRAVRILALAALIVALLGLIASFPSHDLDAPFLWIILAVLLVVAGILAIFTPRGDDVRGPQP